MRVLLAVFAVTVLVVQQSVGQLIEDGECRRCDQNADCKVVDGRRRCVCHQGYVDASYGQVGHRCTRSACTTADVCPSESQCLHQHSSGKALCICLSGMVTKVDENGKTTCVRGNGGQNECLSQQLNECDPKAYCMKLDVGYKCQCPEDTVDVSPEGRARGTLCENDHCKFDFTCPTNSTCITISRAINGRVIYGTSCKCLNDFVAVPVKGVVVQLDAASSYHDPLSGLHYRCMHVTDVNECTMGMANCRRDQICQNLRYGYKCVCGDGGIISNSTANSPERCTERLARARSNTNRVSPSLIVVGAFEPQCATSGDYLPTQCHASTGFCWCVHIVTGAEIVGTRRAPGQTPPDCNSDRVRSLSNSSESCAQRVIRLRSSGEANTPGARVPQCTVNGDYNPRQCDGSSGYCWCVDTTTGQETANTRTRPGANPPQCGTGQTSETCRDHVNRITGPNADRSRPLIGAFIPQCQPSGDYTQLQCHGSTGFCWCVDTRTGAEISGSRRAPGTERPDCQQHLATSASVGVCQMTSGCSRCHGVGECAVIGGDAEQSPAFECRCRSPWRGANCEFYGDTAVLEEVQREKRRRDQMKSDGVTVVAGFGVLLLGLMVVGWNSS